MIVSGHGPETSPVMIIGDYPTPDELKTSRAFSGYSGDMVNRFLRDNNWSLEKCYKTNYIKCGLPGFATKNKKKAEQVLQTAREQADWNTLLSQEIRSINPNVILCLGELALNFLTGEKSIYRFRGSILQLASNLKWDINRHIRVIPALHPRDITANIITAVYTRLDYAKAIKNLANKLPIENSGHIWLAKNSEAINQYWKRASGGEYLTTDIESSYNMPTCISFCTDGQEAISVPLIDKSMTIFDMSSIWSIVDEILRHRIPKVNQNIKYDWMVLERHGLRIKNIIGDTMLMANTIYPELPKGLDFLTSIYTDIPYYKDEGKEYDARLQPFDDMMRYNAKDSLATWRVWKAQQVDAEDQKVKHFYFNLVQPAFFIYKKIDERGIRIDEEKRFQLLEKYTNLLHHHLSEIKLAFGSDLNVRSPKQVGSFVYDFLRCPVHTHVTPGGDEVFSTDEDTLVGIYLNEIWDDSARQLLKQIILCRKILSAINLIETPIHQDGRMRTSYHLGGTKNGRTSTSTASGWYFGIDNGKKKANIELGTAFQKIPKHGFRFEKEVFGKDVREMFVPSPGYSFFSLDGANAEGRVVCVLAEDWDTLNYIEAGNNLHKLTASWIYPMPVEKISKNSEEYNIGKRARHAGHLGQTGAGLSSQIYKSIKFCNKVMDVFHKYAPKIREVFQYGIEQLIRKTAKLTTPQGRVRDFFGYSERFKHDIFKQAYSYIPQATVADHFKMIALAIDKECEYSYLLFEAHDGLLWEIPTNKISEFSELTHEKSAQSINFSECSLPRNFNLTIPIEQEYSSQNWYDMSEVKR